MDSAYARLRKFNVQHVSTAPQTLPRTIPAAEGIQAFYFRDPAGHNLELIYFPPGKGNPKWQEPTNKIFLGIDHTAIGISNTEASRTFYNDLLGVVYQGESYNHGTEQEHLNNVPGARLRITGNKALTGMGVEFLQYLTPGPGRPYPGDERADDLIHFETIMITGSADALYAKLKSANVSVISPGVVELPDALTGYQKGFYARDPDGHVIGFFEKIE
jgi:catechol 2,3-dioxygenase-like lactoylglutathione lyase family enzyme